MARITRNELNNSVSSTKNAGEQVDAVPEGTRGVVAYSVGLEQVEESSSKAYAKQVNIDGQIIYYIKQDRYGSLYNPQGLYSERNQTKLTRYGVKWSFKEVTKKTFDNYLKFLETKNKAWLANAERELA